MQNRYLLVIATGALSLFTAQINAATTAATRSSTRPAPLIRSTSHDDLQQLKHPPHSRNNSAPFLALVDVLPTVPSASAPQATEQIDFQAQSGDEKRSGDPQNHQDRPPLHVRVDDGSSPRSPNIDEPLLGSGMLSDGTLSGDDMPASGSLSPITPAGDASPTPPSSPAHDSRTKRRALDDDALEKRFKEKQAALQNKSAQGNKLRRSAERRKPVGRNDLFFGSGALVGSTALALLLFPPKPASKFEPITIAAGSILIAKYAAIGIGSVVVALYLRHTLNNFLHGDCKRLKQKTKERIKIHTQRIAAIEKELKAQENLLKKLAESDESIIQSLAEQKQQEAKRNAEAKELREKMISVETRVNAVDDKISQALANTQAVQRDLKSTAAAVEATKISNEEMRKLLHERILGQIAELAKLVRQVSEDNKISAEYIAYKMSGGKGKMPSRKAAFSPEPASPPVPPSPLKLALSPPTSPPFSLPSPHLAPAGSTTPPAKQSSLTISTAPAKK